jgi:hypothetical protein
MAAHVSAVPNHQTGRVTPLFTRAAVLFGAFGYELDPTAPSADEQADAARQVAWYAERRDLLQRAGSCPRSPFEHGGNETAWMTVDNEGRARSGSTACSRGRRSAGDPPARAGRGGDLPRHHWMDTFAAPAATADRTGDELMAVGLVIEPPDMAIPSNESDGTRLVRGDFQARLFDVMRR